MASYTDHLTDGLGLVTLVATTEGLSGLYLAAHGRERTGWERDDAALAPAVAQLDEFLAGERRAFELPRAPPIGTPFQLRVWAAVDELPYGSTTTYGALAAALGAPRAVRAVGAANARNPLSIIRPCHRVLGVSGALTGYGGGLAAKASLLALEASRREG